MELSLLIHEKTSRTSTSYFTAQLSEMIQESIQHVPCSTSRLLTPNGERVCEWPHNHIQHNSASFPPLTLQSVVCCKLHTELSPYCPLLSTSCLDDPQPQIPTPSCILVLSRFSAGSQQEVCVHISNCRFDSSQMDQWNCICVETWRRLCVHVK